MITLTSQYFSIETMPGSGTSNKTPFIPNGSTILVTGASGFIATHIVAEFLAFGYKVRGTSRSYAKAEMTSKLFSSSDYEPVIVSDISAPGAFQSAIKGCSAIVHAASDTSLGPNPNEIIPYDIAGTREALMAAAGETSVKRFVLTGSSLSGALPRPDVKYHIGKDSWNEGVLDMAWAPPPYDQPWRPFMVLAASRMQCEREVWKFVKEGKPSFVVNSVNSPANFGRVLAPVPTSTGSAVPGLVGSGGVPDWLAKFPPQWFVNVRDNARIHVAAAIDPSVENERIWPFTAPYNWNDVLAIIRRLRPSEGKVPKDIDGLGRDVSTVDNGMARELLRKWWGQDGYTGLERTVEENLECVQ